MDVALIDQFFIYTASVVAAYLLCSRLYMIFLVGNNLTEQWDERQRQASYDLEMVLHSRFTIPISVLVPVGDDNITQIMQTLKSLVGLSYPDYEIIVTLTKPAHQHIQKLTQLYDLVPHTHFYHQPLQTQPVVKIWRSQQHAQLYILEQNNDRCLHDASNAALNMSRYRYTMVVPIGVQLNRDALLRLIRPALGDPAQVIAVTAPIGIRRSTKPISTWQQLWQHLQQLEPLKNALLHRFQWQQKRFWIGGLGGIWGDRELVLWRRDLCVQLGGFSELGALSLGIKMQAHCTAQALPYQLRGLQEWIGWQEATPSIKVFMQRQGQAWARVESTLAEHRRILWRWQRDAHHFREYGVLGWLFIPYLTLQSALSPWMEWALFTIIPLGVWWGALPWQLWLMLFILVAGTSLWVGLIAISRAINLQLVNSPRALMRFIGAAVLNYLGFQQLCHFIQLLRRRRLATAVTLPSSTQ